VLNDQRFGKLITDQAASTIVNMKQANLSQRVEKDIIEIYVAKIKKKPDKPALLGALGKVSIAVLRGKSDKTGFFILKKYVLASFRFKAIVNTVYHMSVTNTNGSIWDAFLKVGIDTLGEVLEELLESDNVLVKYLSQTLRKTIGNLLKP
jgi:hypothetical protein